MTDSPPPRLTANEGDSICKTLGSRTAGRLTHRRESSTSAPHSSHKDDDNEEEEQHSTSRVRSSRRSQDALEPVPWVVWSSDSSLAHAAEEVGKACCNSRSNSRLPSPAAQERSDVLDTHTAHSLSHTISETNTAHEEKAAPQTSTTTASTGNAVLQPIEPSCRYCDYPPRYRHTRAYYCPHCTYTVCPACFAQIPRPTTSTTSDAMKKNAGVAAGVHAEGQAEADAASLHTRLAALLQSPASSPGGGISPLTTTTAAAATPSPTQTASGAAPAASPLCHLCKEGHMRCEEVLLYPWCCEGPMPERRLRRGAHVVYDTDIIQRYYFIKEQTAKRAASLQPLVGHYHGVLLQDTRHHSTNTKKLKEELYVNSQRPPYCEEGGSFVFSVSNPRLAQSCVWCAVNLQPREMHTSFTGDTTVTPLFTWSCPPTLPGLPAVRTRLDVPHGLYGLHGVHALALYVTSDIYRKATAELALSPVMMAGGLGSGTRGRLTTLRLSPASMLQPLLLVDILHHMFTRGPPRNMRSAAGEVCGGENGSGGAGAGRKRPRAPSLDLLTTPEQHEEASRTRQPQQAQAEASTNAATWPAEQMYCAEAARCVDCLLQGRSVAVYGLASKYFFLHHVAHAAALRAFGLWSIDASVPETRAQYNAMTTSRGARGAQASAGSLARQLRELERHLAQVAAHAAAAATTTQGPQEEQEQVKKEETHVVAGGGVMGCVRSASPSRPDMAHKGTHKSDATNAVVVDVDNDEEGEQQHEEEEEEMSAMPTTFTRRSASHTTAAPSPTSPLVRAAEHEAFLAQATASASQKQPQPEQQLQQHNASTHSSSSAAHHISGDKEDDEAMSSHTVCSLSAAHEADTAKITRVLQHPLLDPHAPWASAVRQFDYCLPRSLTQAAQTTAIAASDKEGNSNNHTASSTIVPCEVTMPQIRFSSEAQRRALVARLFGSHVPRCVEWPTLPSYLALQLAQPTCDHKPSATQEVHDISSSLLWHNTSTTTVTPTLLVVHNMDLLGPAHIATLQRLVMRYAQPRHGYLQLLFSFDAPHWPSSTAAASLQALHPVMLELRHTWWLPRIHEMRAYNTLELLTSFEAGAAGGAFAAEGRRGRHGTRAHANQVSSSSAFASGSLVMQDTMRRILFSLPAAFADLLRIMIATQEEAGEGHYVSLFTHMENFEKNGLMVSQGRLQALKRELTSNRLAVYDAAEHALHIPQHRKLAKVLEEVTAQRRAVNEAKGLAEMT